MKKLELLPYAEYMNTLDKYCKQNWDNNLCDVCGGAGVIAIMCCSGIDCMRQGAPVDFILECKKCGRKCPSEI